MPSAREVTNSRIAKYLSDFEENVSAGRFALEDYEITKTVIFAQSHICALEGLVGQLWALVGFYSHIDTTPFLRMTSPYGPGELTVQRPPSAEDAAVALDFAMMTQLDFIDVEVGTDDA